MDRKVRVGITHGDINGVGYEIILKALANELFTEICTPVIFGSQKLAEKCRRDLGIEDFKYNVVQDAASAQDGQVNLVDIGADFARLTPGESSPEAGRAAVLSLEAAAAALENGDIDVMVTAPICKQTTNSEEFHFPGHTEYLQERLGNGAKSLMILFDDNVRIALVTTHLPISEIPRAITKDAVVATVKALDESLKLDFSINGPKIAVLSLNPHCGDGGLLGTEEQTEIIPAVNECNEMGILTFGPFAADGFFSSGAFRKFDGVVACYHDQGLAPFKALAGEKGVNFTAGLPYVRTSPDHGTAFDIAWKGEADPTSMREAIYKAIDIFRSRSRNNEAAADPLKIIPNDRQERGPRDRHQRKDVNREPKDRQAQAQEESESADAPDNQ